MKRYINAGLSGSALKMIAMLTMLIDHTAVVMIGNTNLLADAVNGDTWHMIYNVMRFIGRIAFPIYCFLLVEGYYHTSNLRKYIVRMIIFAFVSEVPFDLAIFSTPFYAKYQNVGFTLLIGLIVIAAADWLEKGKNLKSVTKTLLQMSVLVVGMLVAWLLKTDYGAFGIVFIYAFYDFRNCEWKRNIVTVLLGLAEITAGLAVIPIHFYNGTRGVSLKKCFYLFYPVHFLILYIIACKFFS